jgi:hypothetical protein
MDIIIGGIGGGLVGGIAAVNLVIFTGIEPGYEASIPEVFRQNLFIGLLTVLLLGGGPLLGVIVARRVRRQSHVRTAP